MERGDAESRRRHEERARVLSGHSSLRASLPSGCSDRGGRDFSVGCFSNRIDSQSGPEVGSMLAKRLFPLFVFSVCVFWLGAKVRADESPLTRDGSRRRQGIRRQDRRAVQQGTQGPAGQDRPRRRQGRRPRQCRHERGNPAGPLKGLPRRERGAQGRREGPRHRLVLRFHVAQLQALGRRQAGRRQAAADHEVQGQRGERARHALPGVQRQARRRG